MNPAPPVTRTRVPSMGSRRTEGDGHKGSGVHPAGSRLSEAVCMIGARTVSIDGATVRGSGPQGAIHPKRSASRVRRIRNAYAGVGLRWPCDLSEGSANFSRSPSRVDLDDPFHPRMEVAEVRMGANG